MKISRTVWQETFYIFVWTLLLSCIMEAVFLVIGYWDYTVILGNLLGILAGVGNFLGLAYSVQKAVEKEEKAAKKFMQLSHTVRFLITIGICILGGVLSCFHVLAVLIPLLFPRIAIVFRPKFGKKTGKTNVQEDLKNDDSSQSTDQE